MLNAQEADSQWLTPEEMREFTALLNPDWETSLELTTGFGWDSNLLLTPTNSESSSFATAGLDATLWKRQTNERPWQIAAFTHVHSRWFKDSPTTSQTSEIFGQVEGRWEPWRGFRLALRPQAFRLKSVMDFSTETTPLISPITATGTVLAASLRQQIGHGWTAEIQASTARNRFQELPEDHRENRLEAHMIWESTNKKWEADLSVSNRHRDYDTRTRTTIAGRPLPGTILAYRRPSGEAQLTRKFQWQGDWKAQVNWSKARNHDNGAGYYDYVRTSGALSIDWENQPWRVTASVGQARVSWDNQTVGIGIAPPPRLRHELNLHLTLEREFGQHWRAHTELERERVDSNDATETYTQTRLTAGLTWIF